MQYLGWDPGQKKTSGKPKETGVHYGLNNNNMSILTH